MGRSLSGDSLDCFLSRQPPVREERTVPDGTLVGQWRITGFIGRGGSSEVYAARHEATGKRAAIKLLRTDRKEQAERFRREATFLGGNANRAFPVLYGCGEMSDRPFMAMELLDSMPLPSSDGKVASFIEAVSGALAVMHRKGFVHRDVKPANILWRSGTEPVLADLGLMKRIDTGKSSLSRDFVSIVDGKAAGAGTPKYASPEQMAGAVATPQMDVHAIGMTAHECFGGKPPRCWRRIIQRATSSIPEERFADAEALLGAVRRRHWPAIGATVLAIAALTFGVFFALTRQGGSGGGFPKEFNLNGQSLTLSEPIVLEDGKTYMVTGPGTLDAEILASGEATLWLTNCTVISRSSKVYPVNPVKYELAGDVYLNFINLKSLPEGLRLSDFVSSPAGADSDLLSKTARFTANAIRLSGPPSHSDLIRAFNSECLLQQ